MTKATQERTSTGFADFLQTAKIFHTNLISAILSANIYAKSCFSFLSKANLWKFSLYCDKIQ